MKIEITTYMLAEDLLNHLNYYHQNNNLTIEDLKETIVYVKNKIKANVERENGYRQELKEQNLPKGNILFIIYMNIFYDIQKENIFYKANLNILNDYLKIMKKETRKHKFASQNNFDDSNNNVNL